MIESQVNEAAAETLRVEAERKRREDEQAAKDAATRLLADQRAEQYRLKIDFEGQRSSKLIFS
jgi:hypothetical protein